MNSLLLSIDHFNRPWDCGRIEAVLIFLNHSFEMLLKAAILHKGGRIRERRAKQTIGFDQCVRKALSDGGLKFISDEQAVALQTINSLRDAAEHHLVALSEQHLAVQMLTGLTLFRDVTLRVFGKNITADLPQRAIAVSTTPPTDLAALFAHEVDEVKKLLRPGTRKALEAQAKLRGLSIVEGAIKGERVQPSEGELSALGNQIAKGSTWEQVFPGVASITLTATGTGPSIDLRITKKEGIPITLVPEGTPGAAVVAVKRVDDLGFYTMGLNQVAEKIGLTAPKALALIRHQKLQSNPECFKEVRVRSQVFKNYSAKAVSQLIEAKATVDMNAVWKQYGSSRAGAR